MVDGENLTGSPSSVKVGAMDDKSPQEQNRMRIARARKSQDDFRDGRFITLEEMKRLADGV